MLILNEETFDPRIIDLEREKNCNSSTSQVQNKYIIHKFRESENTHY